MRVRLECTQGTSRKFWEAALFPDGSAVVKWGRIGTEGQSQQRDYQSKPMAVADIEKAVGQKCSKGYQIVSQSSGWSFPKGRGYLAEAMIAVGQTSQSFAEEITLRELFREVRGLSDDSAMRVLLKNFANGDVTADGIASILAERKRDRGEPVTVRQAPSSDILGLGDDGPARKIRFK